MKEQMTPQCSMKGGHLLGQGSYGCAFTPPLLCKSGKTSNGKKVGKVTLKGEADHEIEVANLLRKVPLVKNYILLPDPEHCELVPMSKQKDKDVKDCEAVTRQNNYKIAWSDTRQIFIPFGGKTPIGNLLLASNLHPKYFPFFDFMKHVLEAGSTLLIGGVCHFDLHPNNFILDEYNVVRILDLGLAFNARSINQEIVDNRWKVLMFGREKDAPHEMVTNAEAPEITVMNAVRNGFSLVDAVNAVVEGKDIFTDMERYLGITKQQSKTTLLQFFRTSNAVSDGNTVDFFKLYWTGFDSWAIGCLILTVLKYQITFADFLQGEWQQRQSMTLLALKGLLNPSPRFRLDCLEALFLFDPNNEWVRQFGKGWLEQRKVLRGKITKN